MAVYKIIQTIQVGSGYLKAPDGSMVSVQDLVPKAGDIVTGEIEGYNIGNKKQSGIMVNVSTGLDGPAGNTFIFISEEYLEPASVSSSNSKRFLNAKNMTIILLITAAVVLYFRAKKLKA